MITNQIINPVGESLALNTTYQPNGFGPVSGANSTYQTVLFVTQTPAGAAFDPPDPNRNKFAGRQVYELPGVGNTSDGCYNAALALGQRYPSGPLKILGSVWNVGGLFLNQPSTYGSDQLGWQTSGVAWYRTVLAGKLPCTATASQSMNMVVNIPGYQNVQFATHNISITINAHSVTVTKDGLSETETTF